MFLRQWLAARSRQDQALADTRQLAERRLAALVARSAEAILLLGPDLRVRYASPGTARLFSGGAPPLGAALVDLLHPADQQRAGSALDDVRRGGPDARVEWRIAQAGQDWLTCESVLSNQFGDPAVQGLVENLRDISERVALEERLRHQSLHDALTGVANRAVFIDRLMQALVRRRRQGGSVAVLFLDLDHFKLINATVCGLAKIAGVTKPITGRVAVDVRLYPNRPQDWQKRAKRDPMAWDDTVQCIDLDNATKVLFDALKGVAIEDDKWVRRIISERMEPDGEGRVEVTITAIVPDSVQGGLI